MKRETVLVIKYCRKAFTLKPQSIWNSKTKIVFRLTALSHILPFLIALSLCHKAHIIHISNTYNPNNSRFNVLELIFSNKHAADHDIESEFSWFSCSFHAKLCGKHICSRKLIFHFNNLMNYSKRSSTC